MTDLTPVFQAVGDLGIVAFVIWRMYVQDKRWEKFLDWLLVQQVRVNSANGTPILEHNPKTPLPFDGHPVKSA